MGTGRAPPVLPDGRVIMALNYRNVVAEDAPGVARQYNRIGVRPIGIG